MLDALHNCLDFDEIEAWLRDNAAELGALHGLSAPSKLCIADPQSFPERWSFYFWTSGYNSAIFVRTVMPTLGFRVHWTFGSPLCLLQGEYDVDSSLSMAKEDWPIMQVCEILRT